MSAQSFISVLPLDTGEDITVAIGFWYTPSEGENWDVWYGGNPAVPESWDDVEVVSVHHGNNITQYLSANEMARVHDKIEQHLALKKEKTDD